jgi:hypothetical protein
LTPKVQNVRIRAQERDTVNENYPQELREEIASYERLSDRLPSEKYKKQAFDQAKEATEILSKALNGGPSRAVILGMLSSLMREHRYLQQEQVVAMLSALGLVDVVSGCDARNEFAHGLTSKVRKALKDDLFYIYGEAI